MTHSHQYGVFLVRMTYSHQDEGELNCLTRNRPRCIILLMRIIYLLLIIILLIFSAIASNAAFDYSMWLRAQPQAIVADSNSSTTITAEVRDSSGHAVPDGTMVEFNTSLGIIERSARTAAGVARVRLTSAATTGTALVSAVVSNGNAIAQIRIDFLEPGTEMFDESFISISSPKHLGYDVGGQIIDSAGGVKIYHRGLDISAEEAQINVKKNTLHAKSKMGGDNISIKRGDKEIKASALFYDFNSMNGVILTPAEEGVKRMTFRGRDLFSQPDTDPDKQVTLDFIPITESTMFIRARSIVIRPGEELKIKRANFYLDGDKVLSVPLHVVPLRSENGGLNRMITYGNEGLRLDLPFYYSLTPNGTGSVRLKHSEPTGWGYYSGRAGWQVDVEQEYNIAGSTAGTLSANRVTTNEWGLRWDQRKEFDNDAQLNTYIDFPAHKDLYSTIDYSRPFGDYTMSVNLRGNKRQNADGLYSGSAYLQSRVRPLIGGAVNYAFTTKLFYDNYQGGSGGGAGTGVGLQLYGKPIQFSPNSSLSTSLSVSNNWGGSYAGTNIYASAGYYRSIGNMGQLGLNYNYTSSSSDFNYSSQRISADLSLSPSSKWNTRLYLTRGIGDGSTSAFGDLSYSFMPTWQVQLLGTYQKFDNYKYTDAELAIAKAIGKQEARLIWSQSRKKFRIEFSALSF